MRARLKITAMALATLFALSAVGTSAAQAASSLDVGAVPAFITAEQISGNPLELSLKKETGSATIAKVKCNVARLETTTNAANVTDATFTPSYAECTLGGLKGAEIKVNGCRYTLTNTATALTFLADIASCTTSLEIVQFGCVIKISNQNGLSHIVLANETGSLPTSAIANVTVSMIAWNGGAGCPAGLAGVNGTNAELIGSTTARAFQDVNGVEGAQVKLEAT